MSTNIQSCNAFYQQNGYSMAQFSFQMDSRLSPSINTASSSSSPNGSNDVFSSMSSWTNSSSDDAFSTMGTWEDHAKENNLKVSKKRPRKIRRLRDIKDSDDEWKEPKITKSDLVPNPFCVQTSSDSTSSSKVPSKKMRRVCFNPTISFHYYEPHDL
uniref:Uncharacterized protein n=1 Tax=Caenorhabditis tropicalis TaxID=1561998 RepID=A0A1I7UC85_9PELO